MAESLLELMDSDQEDAAPFPAFLRVRPLPCCLLPPPRCQSQPAGGRLLSVAYMPLCCPQTSLPCLSSAHPSRMQVYDEFVARTMADVQPPSKRRRTELV